MQPTTEKKQKTPEEIREMMWRQFWALFFVAVVIGAIVFFADRYRKNSDYDNAPAPAEFVKAAIERAPCARGAIRANLDGVASADNIPRPLSRAQVKEIADNCRKSQEYLKARIEQYQVVEQLGDNGAQAIPLTK
ncbi:hypothetical protein ACTZIH_25940 (plasmid) [Escherichia coli]